MIVVSKPRLTIGIPVYNGERTLRETLDYCSKLPADLVRILISDNASTDCTYAIAQFFTEQFPNFKVYRHNENLGALYNFGFLLDNCDTEFFMWLGADDVIEDSFCLADLDSLFKMFPQSIAVAPFAMVGNANAQIPDRGNRSLVGERAINVLRFLLRPGVNSRFYSIYKTERLRAVWAKFLSSKNGNYFASDIVFSVLVLQEGGWPMAASFRLSRKPGISSDGWSIRKEYSKKFLSMIFPSIHFITQIVKSAPPYEKAPVMLIAAILYLRYLIGPLKHRLNNHLISRKPKS